jgi:hypothetical protein
MSLRDGEVKFAKWIEGLGCPFEGGRRDYYFMQDSNIWEPGAPTMSSYELLSKVWDAGQIDSGIRHKY